MSTLYKTWVTGEQVYAQDLTDIQQYTRNMVGYALWAILGTPSFLPSALAVPFSYSGLNVTIGAPSAMIYLANQLCFHCPATVLTLATNAGGGSARTDLVVATPTIQNVNVFSRNVKSGPTISPQSCYEQDSSYTLSVVQGTVGGGVPATPGGTVALATYTLNAGSSVINNQVVLLPTAASLIAAGAGGVSSLNGKAGALNLVSRDGRVAFDTTTPGQIGLTLQNAVLALAITGGDTYDNIVGITAGAGITITDNGGTGFTLSSSAVPVAQDTDNVAGGVKGVKVRLSGGTDYLSTDSYPIGSVIRQVASTTTPATVTSLSVTFPTLPTDRNGAATTWLMTARFALAIFCDGTTGGFSLTPSNGGTGWSGTAVNQPSCNGLTMLEYAGSASSGQAPSCSVNWSGVSGYVGPSYGKKSANPMLVVEAVRVS